MKKLKTSSTDHLSTVNALLKISSLVLSKLTLLQIYEKIHEVIAEVIYVKNIAIFLYDQDSKIIKVDYLVDDKDGRDLIGQTIPAGKGLSSYVINKNKPCIFSGKELKELEKKGEINELIGSLSKSWMGCPISNNEKIIGIIILQSYTESELYNENDLQLLSFVADNLAIVLQQREYINKEAEGKRALEKSLGKIQQQNEKLAATMAALQEMQEELIQKEKMASLGNLVAGIAHEINTPIGICVTGISNLHYVYQNFQKKVANQTATDQNLVDFFEDIEDSCQIIKSNTQRAAQLINSFKEVAVDQSSEVSREINIKDYINEILLSMRPVLKKLPHEILLDCPEHLYFETIPGAIAQVMTNMINNSIIHGLEDNKKGTINISASVEENTLLLSYQDNGKGLNKEELKMLFEPFFTTKRGSGGSGLGTHLIYNLVTSTLNGKIIVQSEKNNGLRYEMHIPTLPAKES